MSASSRNRSSRSGTPEAPKAASPRPASAARTSATARSRESRCTSLWYNRAVRFLVLDRYIVRELIPPFALSTALFTFFLIIDRIYHLADLAVTKGVPLHLVVQLLVFMLPSFLAHTLPMALLVAILLAGGRLAGDLEIIALKAAGVSALRLFRPVLAVALTITAVTAGLTLVANPLANREFQRQLFKILQSRAVSSLQERVFNNTFGDVIIYVEDVSASQVGLRGLLVSDERDPKLSRIITAREGRLLTDEVSQRITLRLLNGAVSEADVMPADPPKGLSKDVTSGGAASAARYRYTLFGLYDLSLAVDSPLKGAPRVEKPEKDLTLGALVTRIAELRADRHARAPYLIELHKRFALPLAAVVFTLVAFPLAIRSHRGGRSVALAGSLAILLTYYFVMTSLEGVALRLQIPAGIAIWTPNVLFTIVGMVLLVATTREWRLPPLPLLWRGIDTLAALTPSRQARRGQLHPSHPTHDSTHIIDRYLVREYLTFMGVGLAVAAALFMVIELLRSEEDTSELQSPVHLVCRLLLEKKK